MAVGDLLLLGRGFTGASGRKLLPAWQDERLQEVLLGRITRPLFSDPTPLWPDIGEGPYPHRIGFELIDRFTDVQLAPGGPLSSEVVDAMRKSAIVPQNYQGYVAPVSGSPLLQSPQAGTNEQVQTADDGGGDRAQDAANPAVDTAQGATETVAAAAEDAAPKRKRSTKKKDEASK